MNEYYFFCLSKQVAGFIHIMYEEVENIGFDPISA